MATNVFYRCTETDSLWWTVGKEYEADHRGVIDDAGDYYGLREIEIMISDGGRRPTGWSAGFQRIERNCFEANGHTWFKHVPGDPRPCDGDSSIHVLCIWEAEKAEGNDFAEKAKHFWFSQRGSRDDIIGWRFAGSAKPEQADRPITSIIKRVCAEYSEDESERNDLIAAVDDGHLTPGQKAYIQDKEDAQAAKQQLKHDAEAKALQERADQLSDAGKAMDRVNQDHGHRLGWMA